MPLTALFIIFDLVVHNPTHADTDKNLALLDVATGYFSMFEYNSSGSIPGSLASGFSRIAREYVRSFQTTRTPTRINVPSTPPVRPSRRLASSPQKPIISVNVQMVVSEVIFPLISSPY